MDENAMGEYRWRRGLALRLGNCEGTSESLSVRETMEKEPGR
jgi:hypothetical protein